MKTLTKLTILGCLVLAVCFTASTAVAAITNMNRPLSPLGSASGEPTLQQIFDNNYTLSGGGSPDAINDQSVVAIWTSASDSKAFRVSVNRGDIGTLGIYSYSTTTEVDLNIGSDNVLNFKIDNGDLVVDGSTAAVGFGNAFGFYWRNTSQSTIGYTEDSKNTGGYGPDNNIMALTYLVPHNTTVQTMAGTVVTAGNNDWTLAFEDRLVGDKDFQDSVFLIEDIAAVPELPAGALVPVLGLIGFGAFFLRKLATRRI